MHLVTNDDEELSVSRELWPKNCEPEEAMGCRFHASMERNRITTLTIPLDTEKRISVKRQVGRNRSSICHILLDKIGESDLVVVFRRRFKVDNFKFHGKL